MKTKDQIDVTPRAAARRNLTRRTAVASLGVGPNDPKLIYYNHVDKGGHFAAWGQPEIFTKELRAAFKSLRGDKATALNR